MNGTIEQQNFPEPSSTPAVFASTSTDIEKPGNPYYADGVEVNYTAPAKWWNWLWNHISAWFKDSKADKESMFTEMTNVLSAASITPLGSDDHQLSQAVDKLGYTGCEAYTTKEENGHKINQPYVLGYTLYIPDTELL